MKKKQHTMASVIHESVPQTMLDIFAKNEAFIIRQGDKVYYVGLLFNAEDIGGLSKRDRRDEAKGSIVEIMNAGAISVFARADMLLDDKLVIIPNATSLDRMEEFSLLRNCPYEWAFVTKDQSIILSHQKTDYDTALRVLTGEENIVDLVTVPGLDTDSEAEDDAWIDEETGEEVSDKVEEELSEEEAPEDELEEVSDEDEELDSEDEAVFDEEFIENAEFIDSEDEDIFVEDEEDYDPEDEDFVQETPEPEIEEIEITEEDVDNTLLRRFRSTELDLDIDAEPFNNYFVKNSTYRSFAENRPEGWLNDYLNERSIQANNHLYNLYQQNLARLNEAYITLMVARTEAINRELNHEDPNTAYGEFYRQILEKKRDKMDNIASFVSQTKREIEKEWNETLEQVGQRAATMAIATHEERYGRSHKERIYNIDADEKDKINNEAENTIRAMHERRRLEAQHRYDLSVSEVLRELSDIWEGMQKEEAELYDEYDKQLLEFLDDNRKNDIAYADALAEQLAQRTMADKVAEELNTKLNERKIEAEQRAIAHREEIERIERETASRLQMMNDDYEKSMNGMQANLDLVNAERTKLIDNLADLDNKNKAIYSDRIEKLEKDLRAHEAHTEHIINTHKQHNRIALLAAIVALVAMLAIGLIGGYRWGQRNVLDTNETVQQQYKDMLEGQKLPSGEQTPDPDIPQP